MILEVFSAKKAREENEKSLADGHVILRLYQDSIGVVFVVAVDSMGLVQRDAMLIRVNPNGTFNRLGYVNPKIGLPLTDGGKVTME
jgi:hypothetical protein